MGVVRKSQKYGPLYKGSDCKIGPCMNFARFGNLNLANFVRQVGSTPGLGITFGGSLNHASSTCRDEEPAAGCVGTLCANAGGWLRHHSDKTV